MDTKAAPHKWLYFVSKHATIIVKFPSINFFLSHFKYLMRLTYTLLVISLHKINVRVCFCSFKYKQSNRSERPSVHEYLYSVAGRAARHTRPDALAAILGCDRTVTRQNQDVPQVVSLGGLSGIQVQLLSLLTGKHQILQNGSLSSRLNFIFEIANEIG